MDGVVNIPVARLIASQYLEFAFERGEFATSPPSVPAGIWKRTAVELGHHYGVKVETRTDPKTDMCITRINFGLPKGVEQFSEEARAWRADNPGWLAEQHLWLDTMPGRGC